MGNIYLYRCCFTNIYVLPFLVPANAFSYHSSIFIFIGLQFVPLLIYQFYRYKQKIIISNNAIISKGLFGEKELKFNKIKGFGRLYWFSKPYIVSHIIVYPKNENNAKIKFDLSYQNGNQLIAWTESNFKDLDQEQEKKSREDILSDLNLGNNLLDRQKKISESKKIATSLNSLGIILSIILIIVNAANNINSTYVQFATIAIPILAILAIVYYKGLIKLDYIKRTPFFDKKKLENNYSYAEALNKSVYSDVSLAIIFPSLVLGFFAFRNYYILDFSNVWIPTLTIALALLTLILLSSKELISTKISRIGKIVFFFIMLLGFGFGVTLIINDKLDHSEPISYQSKIIRKKVNISKKSLIKSKHYQLIIEPWGQYKGRKAQIVKVHEQMYNTKKVNDLINIQYHQGKFKISWYELSK